MSTIWRTLRMEKLTKGQVRRYLIYAVGEILLVVIGILVALQVNNWSNKNKDVETTKTYLSKLKIEAEADIARLDFFLDRAESYVQKVDSFLLIRNDGLQMDDLRQIGIQRQTFFIEDGSHEEIISNGHLRLLPNDVRSVIMRISSGFRSVNKIDAELTTTLNSQHLKMADYFEIKSLDRTNQYNYVLSSTSDSNMALLVFRNYINFSYDWMKT